MSIEYYLRIPGIVGISNRTGHVGDMPIISADFGFGRLVDADGISFGKPVPKVLTITRLLDSSSAALGAQCAKRLVIPDVTLLALQLEIGDFLEIKLSKCLIESAQFSVNVGGSPMAELYTLSYSSLRSIYKKQTNNGTLVAGGEYTYTPIV